ncbi:dihydrofolate reductase family protein [Jiangella alkaliphila]|uniref:Dihydrofolate reductase n=1 Tax=Jiangella alkaliphila TaxID=419479 RepID=A0A1H2HDL7_9ACTN|nr:dihydrofolate reductase family protein [Jiangella alkaliphila]SDU29944.1 Dihydrofolate reductase [Jiangella alkaliphila]
MNTLTLDISISLDGYIAAAGRTPEEPLGRGGERLHDWIRTESGGDLLTEAVAGLGAVITGRRTYDDSLPGWGADGPSGPARRPVVVLTHEVPAESPETGVYSFVTSGIEDALAQARDAAGDGAVCVMGGADIARQYIAAGLVDEISLHVVPVLFGDGTPLFDRTGDGHVELEPVSAVHTEAATHVLYRVLR